MKTYLKNYLQKICPSQVELWDKKISSEAIAFYAALDSVAKVNPLIAEAILQELNNQRTYLKLIASENYSSLAVQLAMGNLMTDKYAEGIAGGRFYAGCDNVDNIENEGIKLVKELFGVEHAYIQPHSGADANLVAFTAIIAARVQSAFLKRLEVKDVRKLNEKDWMDLRKECGNQKMLALGITSGGHLTHGYRMNISALLFEAHHYEVSKESGILNYDQIRQQAQELKPLILLAGYSAYPRKIDFAKMRAIADEVGAVLMVDMAHFAGLVAGKVFTGKYNPVPYADIITSTTHKTLRGPRGGIVLCKEWMKKFVDKGCPAILGGPLVHVMAAKAIAFKEALRPEFQEYSHKIVENAQALAQACIDEGMIVLTGGTDNHLLQINVFKTFGLTGRQAEDALRECGLTMNRNSLPYDENGVWYTSGLRLGTPAVTTLGMGINEMKYIAKLIMKVLNNTKIILDDTGKRSLSKYELNTTIQFEVKQEVEKLLSKFKLYSELG